MSAVQHLTFRERTYQEIVRMIISGEIPAGAPLDEKALIGRLNVSRTPFREAVGTLAKEGLIEIRPYRGFFVRTFSRKETNDLYELRKRLECFAVELAVPNMSDRDIAEFEKILERAVSARRQGDMDQYAEADRMFHERIAKLSENEALVETLSRLSLQIQLGRRVANESMDLVQDAERERDAILYAFRRRDVAAAVALMSAHISDVQGTVLAQYDFTP
ncbi:MAG: GntR family transcriptional regulator [Devosia sp.]|uniref:GntR family transcriptional regulator n=1 Tax=Devosia sp. TaxID=1871048 RepID=UPI0024C9D7D4|nr:GntR family transcriptional regulator [Devosia sp.]UYO00214.1 MAG: GntR family transcriptional regulator [Devosia sp.]